VRFLEWVGLPQVYNVIIPKPPIKNNTRDSQKKENRAFEKLGFARRVKWRKKHIEKIDFIPH